jgi:hypothetical protein
MENFPAAVVLAISDHIAQKHFGSFFNSFATTWYLKPIHRPLYPALLPEWDPLRGVNNQNEQLRHKKLHTEAYAVFVVYSEHAKRKAPDINPGGAC